MCSDGLTDYWIVIRNKQVPSCLTDNQYSYKFDNLQFHIFMQFILFLYVYFESTSQECKTNSSWLKGIQVILLRGLNY